MVTSSLYEDHSRNISQWMMELAYIVLISVIELKFETQLHMVATLGWLE